MLRQRAFSVLLGLAALSALCLNHAPVAIATNSGASPDVTLTATLDGRPIPLADVSRYFCDDFSYPEIHCSTSRLLADSRATVTSLLTSVDYVTVFDGGGFSGAFMNISQDYTMLSLIGWNDRISSFKVRNGETGTFFVDWFYNGSQWSFCCNTQQPSLGGYDNSFSSVQRT